jgi:hypothetical protein
MTKLWVAAQTLPPTGSGGDAFDDAFNESVRSVMYFAWPWIAAVFLLLISGACLLWYRNDPYEKGPLFAALGAGVLAVASGVLGYFRLDAAVRPFGLTAAGVIFVMLFGAMLMRSSGR